MSVTGQDAEPIAHRVAEPAPEAAGAPGPRHRLHPLSPFLHGGKTLMAVVAAISWQGYAQLGPLRWLITTGVALLFALSVSAVSWAMTGYQIVGRELRVHEGLLWRRTRAIPLERVQAVDVVRPLLARLTGLAELRLEVIGAGKTEAPLAYLGMADAVRLRSRLLALSAVAAHAPPPPVPRAVPRPAAWPPPDAARPLHAVDNRQVLVGALMTPHAWFVPIGLVLTAVPFAAHPTVTFIGVASFLTALVGVAQVPVRRILDDWNFRLWTDESGLRLRHGLLDTRNQTVPPLRIQAVSVTRPLLWRPFGWFGSRIDVAGYGADNAAIRAGVLLPVADAPTTRRVVGEVLGGAVDIEAVALLGPPGRARWLAPIAARFIGFAITDRVVAAQTGVLTRRLVVVPLARVQSVRVVQGPAQRALGLASVHVDTAGRLHVVGEHRRADEAYAMAARLAELSRAARRPAGTRAAMYQPTTHQPTTHRPTVPAYLPHAGDLPRQPL